MIVKVVALDGFVPDVSSILCFMISALPATQKIMARENLEGHQTMFQRKTTYLITQQRLEFSDTSWAWSQRKKYYWPQRYHYLFPSVVAPELYASCTLAVVLRGRDAGGAPSDFGLLARSLGHQTEISCRATLVNQNKLGKLTQLHYLMYPSILLCPLSWSSIR